MGNDLDLVNTLIYVVAVIGALVLPVFKSIREARGRAANQKKRTTREVDLGEVAEMAPMVEERLETDVPEPFIGVPPELEPELREHRPPVPPPPVPVEKRGPMDIQLDDGYAGLAAFQTSFDQGQVLSREVPISRGKGEEREGRSSGLRPERLRHLLGQRSEIRRAILLKEILDVPLGLRERQGSTQ